MSGGRSSTGRDLRLDGIRGIAVLLVLLYHATRHLPGGWIGVDVFFVLSGYLITRLLLQERIETGGIDRRAFYGRRLRRLGPALVLLLAVWSLVTLTGLLPVERLGPWPTSGGSGLALMPVIGSLTLVYNWFLALDLPTPVGMGHLWSLSVEEQFYLVWPTVIVAFTARRKHTERVLWRLVLVGVGLSLLLTALAQLRGARDLAYFGSLTSGLGLLIGAGTAIRVPVRSRRWIGAAGLFTILGCALFVPDTRYDLLPWTVLATSVAAAAVISSRGPLLDRFLTLPWLRYAGRRSYAIYLWSSPLAYATVHGGGRTWEMTALLLGSSFVIAELSWRLVERRFLVTRTTTGALPARASWWRRVSPQAA